MRITWDPLAQAVYIYIADDEKITSVSTDELSSQVNADYDDGDELVGIEILGVTEPVVQTLTGDSDEH